MSDYTADLDNALEQLEEHDAKQDLILARHEERFDTNEARFNEAGERISQMFDEQEAVDQALKQADALLSKVVTEECCGG